MVHGHERQKLRGIWNQMKSRCLNPASKDYTNYGGRGITICERWLSFANFIEDMHPRPQGHLLDRQDNSGPYAPWNCRWVTRQEQNSNRRSCFYVMDGDEHVTLKEYCRRYKLTYRCIVRRVSEWGWPIEKALRVPVGPIGVKYHGVD